MKNGWVDLGYLQPDTNPIRVGSLAWQSWLAEQTAFLYEGDTGHFSAQCEQRRGATYWYAYRRRNGKLGKAYLGKPNELTEAVLMRAATQLTGQAPSPSHALIPHAATEPIAIATTETISYLLLTKVRPPSLPDKFITRTRLTQRINTAITIVSAPSGFGKSTLLNEWCRNCDMPVAWVSFDPEDNNPHQFWATVLMALRMAHPQLHSGLSSEYRVSAQPLIQEFVAQLANKLLHICEHNNDCKRLCLIWDDFHSIQHPDILASVQFLLDHLPAPIQIIIAGHSRPALALGHLRARRLLYELSIDDLRFNLTEGINFLALHTGAKTLTTSDMHTLITRTEGWAAGLGLVSLALNTPALAQLNAQHQFIKTFSGAHAFLQEYFMEQVFQRQPDAVKNFFLKTSILKHLNESLCDAVTGENNGRAMLAQLWQANLFLVQSESNSWYRYHDLFGEMLLNQLQLQLGQNIIHLHRQAAQWYCQNQAPADAIHHLLTIDAWEEAASLIETMALHELAQSGEDSRLLRWLQRLPATVVQHHKTLLFVYLSLAASALSRNEVEQFLLRIETNITQKPSYSQTQDESEVVAEIRQVRQMWAMRNTPYRYSHLRLSDGHNEVFDLLNQLRQAVQLGRQHPDKARSTIQTLFDTVLAREAVPAQRNLYLLMMTGGALAGLLATLGKLRRGEKIAQHVLAHAQKSLGKLPEPASITLVALSRLSYERGQLLQAQQYLQQAHKTDPNPTSSNIPTRMAVQQALIQLAQGRMAEAHATLQNAHELHIRHPSGLWQNQDLLAYSALMQVRMGQMHEAEQLLTTESAESHPLSVQVRGELLLRQKQFSASEILLKALCAQYPAGFSYHPIYEARVMLSIALFEQHKLAAARQQIVEVLNFATPEAYIRPFLEYGGLLAPLLTWVLHSENLAPDKQVFAENILQHLGTPYENQVLLPIETLNKLSIAASISPREHEVLRLLGAGVSNSVIAAQLYISDHTVKTHLINIYHKLGVTNRTQAIAQALALKLL